MVVKMSQYMLEDQWPTYLMGNLFLFVILFNFRMFHISIFQTLRTFEQSYIAHVMAYSACIGPYNSSKCREDRGVLVTKSSSEIIKPISIYLAFSFVVHFYNYF